MKNNFEEIMSQNTNEELIKIVTLERDDYQPLAIETAEKELKKRKIDKSKFQEIRENLIIEKKEKKEIIEKKKTLQFNKQIDRFWIYFGYVALLFTGGIYGIIAGYKYAYSKSKSEKGGGIFVYNDSSREEGKVMLILGCAVFGIHIITRVNWEQL